MAGSSGLALVTLALALAAWVAVQNAWRRRFPEADADPDVLAVRGGCRGIACAGACAGSCSRRDRTDQEESS